MNTKVEEINYIPEKPTEPNGPDIAREAEIYLQYITNAMDVVESIAKDLAEKYNGLFDSLYEKSQVGYEEFRRKLETDEDFRIEVFKIFNMILKIFNSKNTQA